MKGFLLEEKYILEYIKYMIAEYKIKSIEINDAKYHHNTSYFDAPLVLRHGILSLSELNKLGIKKSSSEILKVMDDTDSHANGIDSISLSVVGLKDIDKNGFEHDPFNPSKVDLNISSDIKARRSTTNYENEFLCYKNIAVDKIKSIDIRLLKLIEMDRKNYSIKDIIDRYNSLKDIALQLKLSNLDIPLREMSNGNLTMDVDKVFSTPKLILK